MFISQNVPEVLLNPSVTRFLADKRSSNSPGMDDVICRLYSDLVTDEQTPFTGEKTRYSSQNQSDFNEMVSFERFSRPSFEEVDVNKVINTVVNQVYTEINSNVVHPVSRLPSSLNGKSNVSNRRFTPLVKTSRELSLKDLNGTTDAFIDFDQKFYDMLPTIAAKLVERTAANEFIDHKAELELMLNYFDSKIAYYNLRHSSSMGAAANKSLKQRTNEYRQKLAETLAEYVQKNTSKNYPCEYPDKEILESRSAVGGSNNASAHFNNETFGIGVVVSMAKQNLIPNKLKKKIQEELLVLALDALTHASTLLMLMRIYCVAPKLLKISPICVMEIVLLSFEFYREIIGEDRKNLRVQLVHEQIINKLESLYNRS